MCLCEARGSTSNNIVHKPGPKAKNILPVIPDWSANLLSCPQFDAFEAAGPLRMRESRSLAVTCGLLGALACAIVVRFKTHDHTMESGRLVFAFGRAMLSAITIATTVGLLLPLLLAG